MTRANVVRVLYHVPPFIACHTHTERLFITAVTPRTSSYGTRRHRQCFGSDLLLGLLRKYMVPHEDLSTAPKWLLKDGRMALLMDTRFSYLSIIIAWRENVTSVSGNKGLWKICPQGRET
ncbi:hypothetical protein CBL_01760 [Carabus blaptoides fortunei]